MPAKHILHTAVAVSLLPSLPAWADDPPLPAPPRNLEERVQQMQQQIEDLKHQNDAQSTEIQQLRSDRGDLWLTEQRASQIRSIVSDVLADSSTRASLQDTGAPAGYDKNFFIASADGNFKLNIQGQVQARFAYNHIPNAATVPPGGPQAANEYGFEMRRVKLFFSGHVIDPSWKYMIQIAFERNGGANSAPTAQSQVSLESAFIEKELGNGFSVRAGEWLMQFNEEEMVGSGTQQFVERSIVNSYFTVKYMAGVQLIIEQDWWRTFLSVTDGGNNRDTSIIQSMNLVEWATTGRIEFLFAGNWEQWRAYQGWIGAPFGMMLGGGLNWQRGTGVQGIRNTVGNGTIPGAPGGGEQASLLTYTADINFRGSGWSFSAAGYGNLVYAFAPTALLPNDVSSYGATVQGGFFVTDNLELIARYEGLWVTNGVTNAVVPNALNNQTLNIVTVGLNHYFDKNQCKFTFDVGYAFNPVKFNSGIFGDNIGGAEWRSTLNAATSAGGGAGEVVVRSQLQLLF